MAYIAQEPDIFLAQYKGTSGYRIRTLPLVISGLAHDFSQRHLAFYFQRLSGVVRLKFGALLFGLAGIVACILDKRLRTNQLMGMLLVFSLLAYLTITAIDNQEFPYYLIYATPFFTACGAVWVYGTFQSRRIDRIPALLLLACACGATIVGFGRNIQRNDYKNVYQPTVATIKRLLPPGGKVYAPSEFGFALGFGPPLQDDCYLGYVSGIQPDVYVDGAGHLQHRRVPGTTSRLGLVEKNSGHQLPNGFFQQQVSDLRSQASSRESPLT